MMYQYRVGGLCFKLFDYIDEVLKKRPELIDESEVFRNAHEAKYGRFPQKYDALCWLYEFYFDDAAIESFLKLYKSITGTKTIYDEFIYDHIYMYLAEYTGDNSNDDEELFFHDRERIDVEIMLEHLPYWKEIKMLRKQISIEEEKLHGLKSLFLNKEEIRSNIKSANAKIDFLLEDINYSSSVMDRKVQGIPEPFAKKIVDGWVIYTDEEQFSGSIIRMTGGIYRTEEEARERIQTLQQKEYVKLILLYRKPIEVVTSNKDGSIFLMDEDVTRKKLKDYSPIYRWEREK